MVSTLRIVLALVVLAIPLSAAGQAHFSHCAARTENNATIIIPEHVAPSIAGQPLEIGDEIAVMTPGGTCAGVTRWTGGTTVITAWGDDAYTGTGGLISGDTLEFWIWDASAQVEHRGADVAYASAAPTLLSSGRFSAGGIYELAALSADSPPSTPAEPKPPLLSMMGQNYPNPFDGATTVEYALVSSSDVTLEVFNAIGQRVHVVQERSVTPGMHRLELPLYDLPSGVYVYRLMAGGKVHARTMVRAD